MKCNQIIQFNSDNRRDMKLFQNLQLFFLKILDWFLVEPKRCIRFVVLSVCSVVVFFQLWCDKINILKLKTN